MENLFFTDKGSGTPVVLLHGFCESHTIWNELSEELSASFRILCPDLPGFGQSNSLNDVSLEEVASTLNYWLGELNIERCILIGHSLGGYVTLAFAETFPEKLIGFGLFHSTCYSDTPEKKETRNKVITFLQTHGVKEFTDTFVPGLFYNKSENVQESIDKLVKEAGTCNQETLISYTRAMRDRTDRCHVINSKMPVLFIAGDKDGAVTIDQSRKQTKDLNPEFVHILPETGHMGMFERKAETTRMVADFLKKSIS